MHGYSVSDWLVIAGSFLAIVIGFVHFATRMGRAAHREHQRRNGVVDLAPMVVRRIGDPITRRIVFGVPLVERAIPIHEICPPHKRTIGSDFCGWCGMALHHNATALPGPGERMS